MAQTPTTLWMLNPAAIPPTQPGGTRHFDFAVEMVRGGYRVEIFASDINLQTRQHNELSFGRLCKREEIDGVGFVWLNCLRYKTNNWRRKANFLSFFFAAIAAGLFRRRPQIIVGSTPHPFSALAGLVLARLRRATFVMEARDLWPRTLIESGGMAQNSRGAKLLRWIERVLCRNAEHIIVFAKGSVGHIHELGVPRERILYLPNGVHMGQFKVTRDRDEVRASLGVEPGQFAVMYAGAHGQLNALHTFIGSAKLTRDDDSVVYVLVGDGVEKAGLVAEAQEAGLTNVRFIDPVAKSQIPDVLNAADALAITLLDIELFQSGVSPNKLFDYMAIGRPVLCAVGGDMADMVREADTGLVVKPENPEDMVRGINELRGDPVRMAAFAQNGPRFIEANYSRQRLVEQMLDTIVPGRNVKPDVTADPGPAPAPDERSA